ncbi:MAG: diguanylate cyclase (GGDEF)-like protein [Desulforhopalus sp.]|jgi:diguanylate cyclase (GGDEF)-like protein
MNLEISILDIIESGVILANEDLTIQFWNKWLVINTGIVKDTAQGRQLDELFPETSFKLLKRKVKIALKLKSSAFTSSTVDRYVIPIKLKKITKSHFQYMRQDVVITPLNTNVVSIIIYDMTPLLEAQKVISDQLALVQIQATTDQLTGCYNRKMFHDLLVSETARASRYGTRFSVIIFDIDDFKSVNDNYGHLVGDTVLKALSTIASLSIRINDVFARWGGEEFTILLPETDLYGAAVVAEKVRRKIAAHDCGEPGHKTCSFGVAQFSSDKDINSIIFYADKAMYQAKENGKNQVVIYSDGRMIKWDEN